jgi:hypothetical protein
MVDERYGRRRRLGTLRMTQEGPMLVASAGERRVTNLLLQQLAYEAALEGVRRPNSIEGPLAKLAQLVRALVSAAVESGDATAATREFRNALVHERNAAKTLLVRRLIEEQSDDAESSAWVPGDELAAQRQAIANWGGSAALTPAETMKRLGLGTRQGLSRRRHARQLFGLPLGERRYVYPRWQFGRGGALVPGLAEVLALAPADDPWGVADLLTSRQHTLDDRSPIEALREDRASALPQIRAILERVYE